MKKQIRTIALAVALMLVLSVLLTGCNKMPKTKEDLAFTFAEGVLTCNEDDIRRCTHEKLQDAFAMEYGSNAICFSKCELEIEEENDLLQDGLEQYTSTLNRDYGLQTTLESGCRYTLSFRAKYNGNFYSGTMQVLVADFDGGSYVIGADLLQMEDAFYEDNFPAGDYYYDMHGEE